MRGCACRGDSGFAHISCLVEYSGRKSDDRYVRLGEALGQVEDAVDGAWKICHNCRQHYVGDMKDALARARFRHVESEEIPQHDPRYVSALIDLGRNSDVSILERALELSKTDEMAMRYPKYQVYALMSLYNAHKNEGGTALGLDFLHEAHRLSKKIPKEIGFPGRFIQLLEGLIHKEESKLKGGTGILDSPALKNELKLIEELDGRNSEWAFQSTLLLAISLLKEGKVKESLGTLKGRLDDARRFLGPDHPTTKEMEDGVEYFQKAMEEAPYAAPTISAFLISGNPALNGKEVMVLRATKDGLKYIIQLPDPATPTSNAPTKVKVLPTKLIFSNGAPVECFGLLNPRHLNGKKAKVQSFDKEKGSYRVEFCDTSLKPCLVKPENVKLLFGP